MTLCCVINNNKLSVKSVFYLLAHSNAVIYFMWTHRHTFTNKYNSVLLLQAELWLENSTSLV